jgi:hypothetical protein
VLKSCVFSLLRPGGKVPKDKIKKFRDPAKPKRGMSAFMLFSNDIRAKVKADNPSLPFGDVAREITRIWKESPPEVHMVRWPPCSRVCVHVAAAMVVVWFHRSTPGWRRKIKRDTRSRWLRIAHPHPWLKR